LEILAVEGEGFVDGMDGTEIYCFEAAGMGEDVSCIVRTSPEILRVARIPELVLDKE
jgi:hypothetical protein